MYLKLKFLGCRAAALGEACEGGTAALLQLPQAGHFHLGQSFAGIELFYALDKSLNIFLFFCNSPLIYHFPFSSPTLSGFSQWLYTGFFWDGTAFASLLSKTMWEDEPLATDVTEVVPPMIPKLKSHIVVNKNYRTRWERRVRDHVWDRAGGSSNQCHWVFNQSLLSFYTQE